MDTEKNLEIKIAAQFLAEKCLLVHYTKGVAKECHEESRDAEIDRLLKLLGKD